jgi:hypothetical protein
MMKKIFLLTLLCFSLAKADPAINFVGPNYIEYDSSQWQLAAQSNIYDLLINKNSLTTKSTIKEITSMTEFHDPDGHKFNSVTERIKIIYSYGIIDCDAGLFNLLQSWYVDNNNKVIYTETHFDKSYLVDMRTRNTPRNDLFQLVCQ